MSSPDSQISAPQVALIGFGEAGESFAGAGDWHGRCTGWDVLEHRRARMGEAGVIPAATAAEALAQAHCVISLVTADAALDAARSYAAHLRPGALWLDMNSVAPATKQAAAAAVLAAGARYADVAVMAPVGQALDVPLLVSGPDAQEACGLLAALGFSSVRAVGDRVGQASAIKLCRSIMVKGLEALTAEMVLAAAQAGVLDEVLASLDASETQMRWAERADYNLDRMLVHGRRRSAEMDEAGAMIRALGIDPMMTGQTAGWQRALGDLELSPPPGGLSAKVDAIRTSPDFKGES